jgi:hypothetical protein
MNSILIRCSSLGRIMANPTAAAIKAGEVLSVGAKTYIRRLVAEAIFGVDFEVSSRQMEKGTRCEPDSIALLNRVLGLNLVKNTERRTDGLLTGECDLHHAAARAGYDLKTSWSLATFPIAEVDCIDSDYEWQVRGYLRLWDAERWTVAFAMVNTPEDLIGYEPQSLHFVDHIPEHHRLTTWTVTRDAEKEALIEQKVSAARAYFAEVAREFDRSHRALADVITAAAPAAPTTQAQPLPAGAELFA